MKIHSIETFGTHEGPGIRLVVFLQGCNLQCVYCHNPDTISLKGGKDLSINNVLELLEAQKSYFGDSGGLTVSGGEPTLQAKELIKLFTEVSRRGFHIALDTNGAILTSEVKELLGSKLWWFCGKDFLLKLDQAYEDKIQYTKAEGESLKYELKVKEFTDHSSNTRMLFVPAKVLDNLGYSNEAHVLNLSPKYKCFQFAEKEPFVEKTDLEAKGQYSEWHEIYGMWGMVRRLPETHFRIYNAA